MSVQDIQRAVATLTADDVARLGAWFDEFRAQLWDHQIEADVEAGRLDRLIGEAEGEYAAGLSRPL